MSEAAQSSIFFELIQAEIKALTTEENPYVVQDKPDAMESELKNMLNDRKKQFAEACQEGRKLTAKKLMQDIKEMEAALESAKTKKKKKQWATASSPHGAGLAGMQSAMNAAMSQMIQGSWAAMIDQYYGQNVGTADLSAQQQQAYGNQNANMSAQQQAMLESALVAKPSKPVNEPTNGKAEHEFPNPVDLYISLRGAGFSYDLVVPQARHIPKDIKFPDCMGYGQGWGDGIKGGYFITNFNLREKPPKDTEPRAFKLESWIRMGGKVEIIYRS